MEPILISFSICVVGVIGAVALFSVAMRTREEPPAQRHDGGGTGPAGPFFLDPAADPLGQEPHSWETVLIQLERHFRMEEAAARSYLAGPTSETLHAPSTSPLWD